MDQGDQADQPAAPTISGAVWLTGGKVVDVASGHLTRQNVRVEDGRISDLTGANPPSGGEVIDLGGRFVAPGLINSHTHLQGRYPYALRREDEHPGVTAIRASAHAARLLRIGVTTVRCLHEQGRADIAVREAARSGWSLAPTILAAGRALSTPDGHGAGLGSALASGPEAFGRAAQDELRAGADHVKVFLSGGLAREGEELDTVQLDAEELGAVVRAAAEASTYVVAHTAGARSIELGLACGVRSFEHAYRIGRSTAAKMAQAQAFLTPTLVVTHSPTWQAAQGFTEAQRARSASVRDEHEQSARLAVAAGVRIVAGTDFPADGREDGIPLIVHELALLTQVGLSPLDALRAATINAAALIDRSGDVGQVAIGFHADLVVTDADPTQDIETLARPRLVLHQGRRVHHDF
jgi:imidazolonepropionase-like amidohydrolase